MDYPVSAKLILDEADVGWKLLLALEIWVHQGQSEGITVSKLNSQQRGNPHYQMSIHARTDHSLIRPFPQLSI